MTLKGEEAIYEKARRAWEAWWDRMRTEFEEWAKTQEAKEAHALIMNPDTSLPELVLALREAWIHGTAWGAKKARKECANELRALAENRPKDVGRPALEAAAWIIEQSEVA